jgi:hypothetical protein
MRDYYDDDFTEGMELLGTLGAGGFMLVAAVGGVFVCHAVLGWTWPVSVIVALLAFPLAGPGLGFATMLVADGIYFMVRWVRGEPLLDEDGDR